MTSHDEASNKYMFASIIEILFKATQPKKTLIKGVYKQLRFGIGHKTIERQVRILGVSTIKSTFAESPIKGQAT